MILELADIRLHPGQNTAFEEAIKRGIATVATRAKGFQGEPQHRIPRALRPAGLLGHAGRPRCGLPARTAVSRVACRHRPFHRRAAR
jgi:hypothetical protein